jgi:hypothetical protein
VDPNALSLQVMAVVTVAHAKVDQEVDQEVDQDQQIQIYAHSVHKLTIATPAPIAFNYTRNQNSLTTTSQLCWFSILLWIQILLTRTLQLSLLCVQPLLHLHPILYPKITW